MIEIFDPKISHLFKFSYNKKRFIYHKLRKIIILFRRILCKLDYSEKKEIKNIFINDISVYSSTYKKNGYCYVPKVFDDNVHDLIKEYWPSRIYFKPGTSMYKSNDGAFKWVRGGREPEYLKRHLSLYNLYTYLRSDQVSKIINEFCNDSIRRTAYSIMATWSTPGSILIPHLDGIAAKTGGDTFVNMIIFIDNLGIPEESGGTAVFESNNYDKVLLRPKSLHNTALIYKSDKVYHGYEPMKENTFRWTINVQFCDKDF